MRALALSFFALLLSFFPPCIIERKMKILEQICRDETAAFSFELENCGNGADCGCPSEAAQCAAQLQRLCLLLRLFAAAMMLTAGAAIATAAYAWRKEKNREFCLYSIVSASVALSWQQIGALPAVGLALFLFIALFFLLGTTKQENHEQ
uniref:hypothetical protein n=1 Tax=Candidatus Electronema sp. TaxID=2698783 RepID=UPI00405751B9